MCVWWGARAGVSMRVCCVTTVLAALALRSAAEAPRRYPEWRGREVAHARPLQDLFEPEPVYAQRQQPQLSPALRTERRRSRNTKRTPHLPSEIASQMMLRASRSNRPYDVPQIARANPLALTRLAPDLSNVVYLSDITNVSYEL
ncbi:unnamed protein product [Diatraea saccharalis]|uniref:Uncharacterized protein n=1 Tax=Diatraea saccharalis TaxID=40085 RepID=A0A9N9WCT6_9NEOP|nr:unnamed protein product [Diatraea saccharalis]